MDEKGNYRNYLSLKNSILILCVLLITGVTHVSAGTPLGPGITENINVLENKEGIPDTIKSDLNKSVFEMFTAIFFALIVIGGIFFILIKIFNQKKRWLPGRNARSIGGIAVGANKSIQIVEIGNTILIVGVGENVTLIDKIHNLEEMEAIKESMSIVQPSLPAFEWVSKLFKRKEPEYTQPDDNTSSSFQDVFQSKMKHMSNRKQMLQDLLDEQKSTDRSYEK